jgi:diadenosine tetraphosphate (Ap4A) HIT family hydrolase
MSCPLCELVQGVRDGPQECVAELDASIVILAHDQFYPGYCIVALKEHAEHLDQLPAPGQERLWSEVLRVAQAVVQTMRPARMNYECLGNMVNHIHWHVIPRYADDPRKHEPIWLRPEAERRGAMPPERRAEIAAQIRDALTGR